MQLHVHLKKKTFKQRWKRKCSNNFLRKFLAPILSDGQQSALQCTLSVFVIVICDIFVYFIFYVVCSTARRVKIIKRITEAETVINVLSKRVEGV